MSAGTIKLTNGSTAVVGTSTTFTSDLKSGDVISTTISGAPYTLFVDTVTSNTALTLSDVFTGPTTTGAAYVAVPQMTLNRITAALAAQTAEAVRRVLQENANWQAFYSGTGDITVTLPNGTPTGVQIPGPSWAKLAGVANSAWIDRGPVGTADNINTYNPNTTEGEWYKSVPTGLTTANGFPDGAVQGTLKVVAGGRWNGTQIYADYNGNQWVRTLTAAWNGTDGPWGAWVITGMGALALLGINTLASRSSLDWNADDFPVGSYFMVTGSSMTNVPAGVTVVGVNQYYIRVVGGAGNTRIVEMCNSSTGGTGGLDYQKYEIRLGGTPGSRTLIARQIWTSSSLLPLSAGGLGANTAAGGRTTLGFDDMGLGPASQSLLTAFDWQQVDFASGANYLVNVAGWTNAPAGLLTPSTDVVNIGVLLCRTNANLFVVNITSQASNGANRYDYNVRVNGAKGSRTFTVIQNYNSDTTTIIPLGNGGTGKTTAAEALTALGGLAKGGDTMAGNLLMGGFDITGIKTLGWSSTANLRATLSAMGFAQASVNAFDIPGASRTMRVVVQTAVVTTNSSANGTVTFPTAFPTACMGVIVCHGDRQAAGAINVVGFTTASISGFNFFADGVVSAACRVNYIAVGY